MINTVSKDNCNPPTINKVTVQWFVKSGTPCAEEYSLFPLSVNDFIIDNLYGNLYEIASLQQDPNNEFHYTNMQYTKIVTTPYNPV